MGRFACPACRQQINVFALEHKRANGFFAMPTPYCPKCGMQLQPGLPRWALAVVGVTYAIGFFAIQKLIEGQFSGAVFALWFGACAIAMAWVVTRPMRIVQSNPAFESGRAKSGAPAQRER